MRYDEQEVEERKDHFVNNFYVITEYTSGENTKDLIIEYNRDKIKVKNPGCAIKTSIRFGRSKP